MTKFYIFLLVITLIPLLLLILSNIFGFFQPQTVQIRGKVVCTIPLSVENTFTLIPAAKARITLFEGDILFNDQLNSTIADEDGFFQIEGKQYEPNFLTTIVQLEHPCGNSDPLSSHCVFVQQTEFVHSRLVDAETKLHSNASGKAQYVIWTDEGNIKCGLNAADKFT